MSDTVKFCYLTKYFVSFGNPSKFNDSSCNLFEVFFNKTSFEDKYAKQSQMTITFYIICMPVSCYHSKTAFGKPHFFTVLKLLSILLFSCKWNTFKGEDSKGYAHALRTFLVLQEAHQNYFHIHKKSEIENYSEYSSQV